MFFLALVVETLAGATCAGFGTAREVCLDQGGGGGLLGALRAELASERTASSLSPTRPGSWLFSVLNARPLVERCSAECAVTGESVADADATGAGADLSAGWVLISSHSIVSFSNPTISSSSFLPSSPISTSSISSLCDASTKTLAVSHLTTGAFLPTPCSTQTGLIGTGSARCLTAPARPARVLVVDVVVDVR